jgi:DNA-directed RNA polymerase specialized sigma24 family protein
MSSCAVKAPKPSLAANRVESTIVCERITNNREDAEGVAQETFHKAFLHLDAFREMSRFLLG